MIVAMCVAAQQVTRMRILNKNKSHNDLQLSSSLFLQFFIDSSLILKFTFFKFNDISENLFSRLYRSTIAVGLSRVAISNYYYYYYSATERAIKEGEKLTLMIRRLI